jgi:transposase
MRKIKQILQLHYEAGLSRRAIAIAVGASYGSVANYLNRAERADIRWPLPDDLDELALGRLLFPSQPPTGARQFAPPDFSRLQQELKQKGVTKLLLWEEYRQQHPKDGYGYAQFCHHFQTWQSQQTCSMRQTHRAGEKLFVDYCGATVPIVNPDTGESVGAQIFVAALGASHYTFACAYKSQQQADWIKAHVEAFAFFGGVPELVVPDNLKSAVRKPHRQNPEINPAYQQMASYYHTAILPARPYKPKDKAKAEVAVQIVQRWILARLRHQTFFTLAALNLAIRDLLEDLNNRPFKKRPGNRRDWFEKLDRPALKPLPAQPYQYVEIKAARVHIDYHVEYDHHYYSVPHRLVKQQVEVQASSTLVMIYVDGQRIASHPRSFAPGSHSTLTEHMPQAHRALSEWSSERFLRWAQDIGSATEQVVNRMLQKKRHPEQNYRSVLALLNLGKKYDRQRLEKACARAILIHSPTRTSVESILKKGLDQIDAAYLHPSLEKTEQRQQMELTLDHHENIRGDQYYH